MAAFDVTDTGTTRLLELVYGTRPLSKELLASMLDALLPTARKTTDAMIERKNPSSARVPYASATASFGFSTAPVSGARQPPGGKDVHALSSRSKVAASSATPSPMKEGPSTAARPAASTSFLVNIRQQMTQGK